jgi:hypothetical protein
MCVKTIKFRINIEKKGGVREEEFFPLWQPIIRAL